MDCYRALYTKQLTKKKKTYSDGYVVLKETRSASLVTDEGSTLSTTRLPSSLALGPDSSDLTCWEGFLVNLDGCCTFKDIPAAARSLLGGAQVVHPVQMRSHPSVAGSSGLPNSQPAFGSQPARVRNTGYGASKLTQKSLSMASIFPKEKPFIHSPKPANTPEQGTERDSVGCNAGHAPTACSSWDQTSALLRQPPSRRLHMQPHKPADASTSAWGQTPTSASALSMPSNQQALVQGTHLATGGADASNASHGQHAWDGSMPPVLADGWASSAWQQSRAPVSGTTGSTQSAWAWPGNSSSNTGASMPAAAAAPGAAAGAGGSWDWGWGASANVQGE